MAPSPVERERVACLAVTAPPGCRTTYANTERTAISVGARADWGVARFPHSPRRTAWPHSTDCSYAEGCGWAVTAIGSFARGWRCDAAWRLSVAVAATASPSG